jgi:hypothetical protein
MITLLNMVARQDVSGYVYLADTEFTTCAIGKTNDSQQQIVSHGIGNFRMPPLVGKGSQKCLLNIVTNKQPIQVTKFQHCAVALGCHGPSLTEKQNC